ncbi:MAG: hypothetical protein ABEJ86_03400 [Halococcoides sp.]
MSLEAFPDTVEIVDSNFKTSQQQEAAETIAERWPVDLDRLVEEGDHVRVFYRRVIEQFLGPEGADMTFAEIEAEYGDIADWPGPGDESAVTADDTAGREAVEASAEPTTGADPTAGTETASETGSAAGGDGSTPDPTGAEHAGEAPTSEASPADRSEGEAPTIGNTDIEAAIGERADDIDDQRRAWFAAGFREGIRFALENPHLVRER